MAITRVGGSWIHKYVSLVADDVTHTYTRAAKPELNLPNGSRCFEMDSDTEYIYDSENDAWEVYVPSSGGGEGTTNYNQLSNKPSINNVILSGNKTLDALGINAGSIGFDETETYTDGSIGAEVLHQKNAISQIDDIVYSEQTSSMVNQSSSLATANVMWGFSIPGITAKRITVAPKWNVGSGTYVAKRWRPTGGTLVDNTYVTEVESKTGTIGEAVSFDDVTEDDAFTFLSDVTTDRMYYCNSGSKTYNVPLIKVDISNQKYRYTVQPLYFPALQLDIVEQYSKIDAIQSQGEENAENVLDIEGILFDKPNVPEFTWDVGSYINSNNGSVITQGDAAIWHDFVTVDDYRTIDLDIDYPADPRSLQAYWAVFTYRLDGTYVGYEWFSFSQDRVRVLKPEYKYRFGAYSNNLSGFTFSEVLAMINFHWDVKTEDEIGLISEVETLEEDFNLVYDINKEVNGGGDELQFFIEKGDISASTGEDSTSSYPDLTEIT